MDNDWQTRENSTCGLSIGKKSNEDKNENTSKLVAFYFQSEISFYKNKNFREQCRHLFNLKRTFMANMVDSLLASVSTNGNTIELSASDNGQGLLPRKKEEVGRLQRRVRTFKGNLTTSITSFINRITYYKNKYPTDDETEIPSVKINYAKDILSSQDRATDRYIKLENALEELRFLVSDTWEDEEEELETALAKLTSEF